MAKEQIFLVDGVSVSFTFDETGPSWHCRQCVTDCEHILIAAARMTLNSWGQEGEACEIDAEAEHGALRDTLHWK